NYLKMFVNFCQLLSTSVNFCQILSTSVNFCLLLKIMLTETQIKLKQLAQHSQTVLIYDNMNFKKIVRDEILDHEDFMRAITTAVIIISSELSVIDLDQSMHDSTSPLRMNDIMRASDVDENDKRTEKQIFMFLISNAIQKIHDTVVKTIF